MRLLLVHEFYRSTAPSGEDAVFANELEMLRDSDIDVVTYSVHNDDIDAGSLMKKLALGFTTVWSRTAYDKIDALIRQHQPDVVHFHNTFPLLSPSVYNACHDNAVPVVQTLHNFRMLCPGALLQRDSRPCEDCISGSLFSSLRYRCYRGSLLATAPLTGMIAYNRLRDNYNRVDRYIALTQFAASRFIAAGFPPEKLAVKPNFLPSPPAPSEEKEDYVVYVGRLSAEKGVATLLDAWQELDGIPLQVLGDGPLRIELEARCRELGLPVSFHGSVARDRVIEIVRRARLQVVPSEWYEGFPMVILEAFASGTPVIASRIGSLDELIVDGETGFKFTAGDAAELAATIRSAWQSKDEVSKMGLNARKRFDTSYTLESNLRQLREIYDQVIDEH